MAKQSNRLKDDGFAIEYLVDLLTHHTDAEVESYKERNRVKAVGDRDEILNMLMKHAADYSACRTERVADGSISLYFTIETDCIDPDMVVIRDIHEE